MARLGIWGYEKAGHLSVKMGSLKNKTCEQSCKTCCSKNLCCCFVNPWKTSILAINSTEMFYVHAKKDNHSGKNDHCIQHWHISDTIMLDSHTSVYWNYRLSDSKHDFYIETGNRLFHFRAQSTHDLIDWILVITNCIKKGKFDTVNRFESFASIKEKNWVKTYLLGHDYFKDVYKAMEKAEYRIYITDWFFSPSMFLIKPIEEHPESQLCKV